MKTQISAPKAPVPRLNSLLHRLQKAQGPDDAPYLDQLMIFLDNPPDDVKNRWKAGAAMCADWGIKTTDTSVWRLYTSYLIEWRVRVELKIDDAEMATPEVLAGKVTQMISLRTCELLGNPKTSPATLLSLFRIELARQKQAHALRTDTERALAELKTRCSRDRYADFVHTQLIDALGGVPSKTRDRINAPYVRSNLRMLGIDPDSVYSLDSIFPNLETPDKKPAPNQAPAPKQTPKAP